MSRSIANLLLVYFYYNIGRPTVNYGVKCFCYVEGSGIK